MRFLSSRHFGPTDGTNRLRNRRKIIFACSRCFHWHVEGGRPRQCIQCRAKTEFYRFDSSIEAAYAAELRLRQQAGEISDLTFHPRYTARVCALGGKDSTLSWTPDGRYFDIRRQVVIVYDVKPKGAPLDPIHNLKERIFRDVLSCQIAIVRK